jgi:hypothetical protein
MAVHAQMESFQTAQMALCKNQIVCFAQKADIRIIPETLIVYRAKRIRLPIETEVRKSLTVNALEDITLVHPVIVCNARMDQTLQV